MINIPARRAILDKEVDSCETIPVLGKPGATTAGVTIGAMIGSITPVSATITPVSATITTGGTITTGTMSQLGTLIVSTSVVTVQPNDNANHIQVLLAPIVIPAASITTPKNVVFAPRVVAAVGVQNTSQADAPLDTVT